MKLDRNINPDGRGKYALVNMRKVAEIDSSARFMDQQALQTCMETLQSLGVLSYGDESPGDQFFVMKYKDKFTAGGLSGYLDAINSTVAKCLGSSLVGKPTDVFATIDQIKAYRDKMKATAESLTEYAEQIETEVCIAREAGNKIPD